MRPCSWQVIVVAGLVVPLAGLAAAPSTARGGEIPKAYRPTVEKGLKWLAKNQNGDGSWSGNRGMQLVPMTALGGMAMLMEGSTLREGKYRDNIRKAADWLMSRQQSSGLIGNPANPAEGGSYMYGHGFSTLFLACLVGEEDTERRRRDLVRVLEKAAKYSHEAQTPQGGWGYTSSKDSGGFDEGSVTITQVQALRACRNAGIVVPADAIKNAISFLEKSTHADGQVGYRIGQRAITPALTAAAICCGFSAGEYNSPLVKKWFTFCQKAILVTGDRRMGHDEYTHYYYAQSVYVLGDDRWAKMFPSSPRREWVTWTEYRKALFDALKDNQSADGSWGATNWTAQGVGPMYATAVYLSILQLDKAVLPIYQR
jgi:squalene cyclase